MLKINNKLEHTSAFAAKVVAGLQALQLEFHLGLREVEIEGDSRPVIRKLQEKLEDRSEIVMFINDSKNLRLGFQVCVFFFTNRESNKVAYVIASKGLRKRETTYLENQVLSGTIDVMAEDRRWT